ncbi:MAG: GNAT family N-acetyltransferase [Micromonosporaceae bacterium]
MDLQIRAVGGADRDAVVRLLRDSWGSTIVIAHGVAYRADELPGLVASRDGTMAGLLTYHVDGDSLEVVTLDAVVRHAGVGSALLAAAVGVAREAGLTRIWLVTSNDNLDALRFYQRRGLRVTAVAPGAVDTARGLKPQIPLTGAYGIPLRDELTLELRL